MQKEQHEWSHGALFAKAQIFAQAMEENADSEWLHGLWSSFTLEMLIRAAVAVRSPALVADNQDWNNVLYAIGIQPKKAKFVPKSAAFGELVLRVEELVPDFTREHANFCISHLSRRNTELHSGNLAFANVGTSTWLPTFYEVCSVLLPSLSESMESLFGVEAAEQAAEDVAALKDDTAKTVKGTVNAHKTIWREKTKQDQEAASNQATTVSLRHYGHRVQCPACGSTALVIGKAASSPRAIVEEGKIQERQIMKPESFSCVACGLKISGYSKLLAAGLGDTYVKTISYDAVEYFEVDIDEHFRGMMEPDNND